MEIQARMLRFITLTNWILLGIAGALGLCLSQANFTLGIVSGGLIVTVNFHLLYRTLRKSLTPPYLTSHHVVIAKYYLRFLLSGVIIFILIAGKIVHPLGMFIGLSVVVASIVLATIGEFTKMIFKEAI